MNTGLDSGLYALLLHLGGDRRIRIGRKGVFNFPEGYYVYIGSARPGLGGRLARHRRLRKVLRWHIDYLRRRARWLGAWTTTAEGTSECELAAWFRELPGAESPVPGFGASDCRCGGHLARLTSLSGSGLAPGGPIEGPYGLEWSG